MAISQGLSLKQSQSLVMTPQLQQAIQLLKFNNDELAEFVERELEQNPMLERDETGESPVAAEGDAGLFSTETQKDNAQKTVSDSVDAFTADVGPSNALLEASRSGQDSELNHAHKDDNTHSSSTSIDANETAFDANETAFDSIEETWTSTNDSADANVGSTVAFENWGAGGTSNFGSDENGQTLEERLVNKQTLREHLEQQINIDLDTPQERMIAGIMCDHLDNAGYLSISLENVALQLGCDFDVVNNVLHKLHRFEPSGIFARNLQECLKIQLAERHLLDNTMLTILENLDVLGNGNFPQLAKLCQLNTDLVLEYVKLLKTTNPKPAQGFELNVAQPVTPDVILRAAQAGGWIVELNPDNLPRVLVNNSYVAAIQNGSMREKDREYLNQQLQNANWLMRTLHQRATTIMKVASAIVERQQDFFLKGVMYMRPLVLRDIAEAVNIHESTVSRATRNKFIETPRGVFELKYFFSASISGFDTDGLHSAEAVRHRIKILIDLETTSNIFSDDTLVNKLRAEGIDIARRTVAKYRESMNIPSSIKRKQLKAMTQLEL